MAGLSRKTSILFGGQGSVSNFAQFGSKTAGNPQTSQDPAVIQQLSAWRNGWQEAVVSGDYAAYLEDMNGLCYVNSYQVTYLLQMGIPEWDSSTVYFTGSVVQGPAGGSSAGQWFKSLQGGIPGVGAGQSGNAPPAGASNSFWQWVNPPIMQDGGLTVAALPKVSAAGPATLVNSAVSDDGTNVILSEPLKFPDNTIQSTAAKNSVSVQSVVTGSRALGTIFQNTGTSPLFVAVCMVVSGTSGVVLCDSNSNPTTVILQNSGSSGAPDSFPFFFIVLPGYYYKVTGSSLITWTEWH